MIWDLLWLRTTQVNVAVTVVGYDETSPPTERTTRFYLDWDHAKQLATELAMACDQRERYGHGAIANGPSSPTIDQLRRIPITFKTKR